jgi:hypothetical protein
MHRAQILVCIIGFAVSLVPSVLYTDPFWGVEGFMDKEPFAVDSSPGVVLVQIAPDSPAALIGLQRGDRILRVNDKQVDFGTIRRILKEIHPGESIVVDIERGRQPLRLAGSGEPSTLYGVLFLDWQFVSAPVFLVLLLVLIATQPLDPPPLWRAIILLLSGLAVVSIVVVVERTQFAPWTAIWQSRSLSHAPPSALHYSLALATLLSGLALSILSAFSIRAVLIRRATV